MRLTSTQAAILFAPLLMVLPAPGQVARSNEAVATLHVQLNKVETTPEACRITFLVENGLKTSVDDLKVEVVVFDKKQSILKLVTLAIGALPQQKSRVRQYDIRGLECDGIGRLLMNELKSCEGPNLSPEACAASVKLTSHVGIPFND